MILTFTLSDLQLQLDPQTGKTALQWVNLVILEQRTHSIFSLIKMETLGLSTKFIFLALGQTPLSYFCFRLLFEETLSQFVLSGFFSSGFSIDRISTFSEGNPFIRWMKIGIFF